MPASDLTSSTTTTTTNPSPNSTSTSTTTTTTTSDGAKVDLRKNQKKSFEDLEADYSSSDDLPPPSHQKGKKKTVNDQSDKTSKAKKGSSKSSKSSSKASTHDTAVKLEPSEEKPAAQHSVADLSSAGRLELELLGYDHGSSAASSAVGEVSERNIKGGRYDVDLPEFRKGQNFVQPTNIPIRILTNFSLYNHNGTLSRLEKLPQLDDAYGCFVGQKRTSFVRAGASDDVTSGAAGSASSSMSNASVVVSEQTMKVREEQDVCEKKESEENQKHVKAGEKSMQEIQPVDNFLMFGTVVETLPAHLHPRPAPRPLSRWQRTALGTSTAPRGRSKGLRAVKMQKVLIQYTKEEREAARLSACARAATLKVPMSNKGVTVERIGLIHTVSPNFHGTKTIFPIGYRSVRFHTDIDNVSKKANKVKYVSEIVIDPRSRESGVVEDQDNITAWTSDDQPLFRVSKLYAEDPKRREWFQGPSSTSAWIQILKLLNNKKSALGMSLGATTVSGPNMFGLDNPNVRALIESNEGSLLCATYVHNDLREEKVSKKRGPQLNPARSKKQRGGGSGGGGGSEAKAPKSKSPAAGPGRKKRAKTSAADLINIGEGDFKVDENGALLELPAGWSKQVKMREQGATAGQRDTYFLDPNGKRYRSVVEVERALGLRAPKGSAAAAAENADRKKKQGKKRPRDSLGGGGGPASTVVPLKKLKKQMNVEEVRILIFVFFVFCLKKNFIQVFCFFLCPTKRGHVFSLESIFDSFCKQNKKI